MEQLVVFFVGLLLTVPLAALVLAIVALAGRSRTTRRLEGLERELATLNRRVDHLDRRFGSAAHPATDDPSDAAASPDAPVREAPAREVSEPTTSPTTAPAPSAPAPAPADAAAVPADSAPPPDASPRATSAPQAARVATPPKPPSPKPAAPRPTAHGLERLLGTQGFVWLGAIALALAGTFLVKYSVDRGLIGPEARVVLGLAFGGGLLGLSEWMVRRSRLVARGFAGSGVAVLYAALLAGVRLYDLIPLPLGFVGMALTTAVAVALSLRHGQLVAVVGLFGGFLTPWWIDAGTPQPWLLMVYLLMLQVGLLAVSRRRHWWLTGTLTLAGALAWALAWLTGLTSIDDPPLPLGLLLVGIIGSFVAWSIVLSEDPRTRDRRLPLVVGWAAAASGIVLLAFLVEVTGFGLVEWGLLGLVSVGCLVLGRARPAFEGLAWMTALAGASLLFGWGVGPDTPGVTRLAGVAIAFGALHVLGPWSAAWGAARPDRWSMLSAAAGIVYVLAAWGVLRHDDVQLPWGVTALIVAAVELLLALPWARRRARVGDAPVAAYAVAVNVLVGLAIPFELEREWITVGWALQVPALAWLSGRLRVRELPTLAGIAACLVAVRLLLNPEVVTGYPTGDGIWLNWLAYGYGIPVAAFVAGAIGFRRLERRALADALEVGATLLGLAWIALQVRQYFHPGQLDASSFYLAEWAAFGVGWMVLGLALLALHRRTGRRLHLDLATGTALLGAAECVLIPGLVANPRLLSLAVGETPVFNTLLFAYALPAALCLVAARWIGRQDRHLAARSLGIASLWLAFLTVSLQVRQAFHGSVLSDGAVSNAEMYSYSLAWILFGTILLIAAIFTRNPIARYGSAVVMVAAVVKVFLIDTANLEDLYRVFSLLGLGASLMLLAFLYQRFVFSERRT